MRHLLLWTLLLVSSTAVAAPNLVVGDLKGDKKGAVGKPLKKAICAQVSCVAASKVGLPKKIDWKKASKAQVDGVLTGTVAKGKVKLELHTGPGAAAQSWSFAVAKGKLNPADVSQVREDLVNRFAPPPPPPAPTPEVAPPPPATVAAPAPKPAETKPAPAAPPPPPASAAKPAKEAEVKHVAAASSEDEGPALVHLAVGLDVERRTLRYSGLTTNNLSEYEAPAIYSPRLQLEAYPLAHSDGPIRGLGLALDYRFAVGLASAVSGGATHPTRQSVFSIDARYRIDPFGDNKFGIIPFVGYRRAGFRVDPASDHSTFVGLPTIVTGGPRFGVAADLSPVDKLHLLGQFDYELVLAKADLISAEFFPSGSANSFELNVGAGYEIIPHLDVQLVFELTRTGFSFATNPGPYQASSAAELLLGGRLMVGYSF